MTQDVRIFRLREGNIYNRIHAFRNQREMDNEMSLRLVKEFDKIGLEVNSVELSPDERLLAVSSYDAGKVFVYDTSSGEQKWATSVYSFQAFFSPDGTQLAVTDYFGNCIQIFASHTATLLRTLSGHTANVCGVAWSSTGIIASASWDNTVRLWNPDNGTCLRTLSGHSHSVRGVSFSPDGIKLASCSNDNTVRIWDVESGTCLRALTGHNESVCRVAFSPDGSKLASSSGDGTVRIWDASSNFNLVRSLAGAGGGSEPTIAWTSDSRILASANSKSLQLWDQSDASILQAQNQESAVSISRFSHEIITGSMDGIVKRWKSPIKWPLLFDVKKGIPFGKLPVPSKSAHDVSLPSKSTHDVSRTLERVSTIIERVDLPVAPHDQVGRLHELNNPIFKTVEKKAKIAGEIEQGFSDLINRRRSLREAHESLQIKAHERLPVIDVKQDLSSIDSSVQSIFDEIPIINKHLQEYAAIKLSSDTSSLKQYEHPSPKELSAKELHEILLFSNISKTRLVYLERVVVESGNQFKKALLEYDNYAGEIREQSEENLDALNAFLAYLTQPSISVERLNEIESTLSKLQAKLDGESKIMTELDRALSAWKTAKDGLSNLLEAQGKGQKIKTDIMPSTKSETPADLKTDDSGDGRQQSSSHPDVDSIENRARQMAQAKAQLESTSGIAHNPHLVYKWLHEHPDCKVDAEEVFDIIGIL